MWLYVCLMQVKGRICSDIWSRQSGLILSYSLWIAAALIWPIHHSQNPSNSATQSRSEYVLVLFGLNIHLAICISLTPLSSPKPVHPPRAKNSSTEFQREYSVASLSPPVKSPARHTRKGQWARSSSLCFSMPCLTVLMMYVSLEHSLCVR